MQKHEGFDYLDEMLKIAAETQQRIDEVEAQRYDLGRLTDYIPEGRNVVEMPLWTPYYKELIISRNMVRKSEIILELSRRRTRSNPHNFGAIGEVYIFDPFGVKKIHAIDGFLTFCPPDEAVAIGVEDAPELIRKAVGSRIFDRLDTYIAENKGLSI